MNPLRPQRLHRQRVRHRGINASAEEEQNPPVFRRPPDLLENLDDAVFRMPIHAAAAYPKQEVAQDLRTIGGVNHLGMELQPEVFALQIAHRRHRALARVAQRFKSGRQLRDMVAVAHPDSLAQRQFREEGQFVPDPHIGLAVFVIPALLDLALEVLRHELVSIADPQHRAVELKQARLRSRAPLQENACRTAGDNDAFVSTEPVGGRFQGQNLSVDAEFAHFPGNQVAVLSARVQDGYFFHGEERTDEENTGLPGKARVCNGLVYHWIGDCSRSH